MDSATCWEVIVTERLSLLERLREFTPEEWDHPTLCTQWRVRHVAAHLISAPQLQLGGTLKALSGIWRGYHSMTAHDGLRRGSATPEQILAEWDRWVRVRRAPLVTTRREVLVDVLVHTQDICRPMGIDHVPPRDAAAVAASRCRMLSPTLHSLKTTRTVRMEATDVDWAKGSGPTVRGPILELLMLCAGRPADRHQLTGDGVRLVGIGSADGRSDRRLSSAP